MIKGFKDFLLRGNIVDLAVAVVIGTAFAKVVSVVISNIINPLLAAIVSGSSLGFGPTLRKGNAKTFMDFGGIINELIVFTLTAAVVYFIVVVPMNRIMSLRKQGVEPEPAAPSEDVILLQEIRDLLRNQSLEGRRDLPPLPQA
ncbi:large conductance mechanosensitive channel protein MscL [Lapillicoccus sp.]|uniref:large conductance mechanosensitive channel protein MscL n=1 Tax=Lapillicoccus sp. TaxID=1909287 RepID=UPI0025EA105A|nr:large conductance mechanosensitive channel protein MscL [Lapillicoccus sp.]